MSELQLDRTMTRGMLLTSSFAALSSAARVAQDAAIAWSYGTSPVVDAYYFLSNLVNWPLAVALSTLTFLLAPAEADLQRAGAAVGQRWRGELLGRLMLIAALALPFAWWALSLTLSSGWSGLQASAIEVAHAGIPFMIAVVPLGLPLALLSAWMILAGRHLLALMEALPPLALAILVLTSQGQVLFWGSALGLALQGLTMTWLLHSAGVLPRPRLRASADTAGLHSAFAQGAWALLAGQALFALIPLVDPFYAARMGDGMVASLSFANRLILGLQGLAGLALQRAGLPLLASLAAKSPGTAWQTTRRWALGAAVGGAVIGMGVAILADPLVGLLFERGRFSGQDRSQVASLLRYGMLQMPPFLAGTVLVGALASSRGMTQLAWAAVTGLFAKLVLSAWLVASHGMTGLLMATALMYTLTSALVWTAAKRRLAPTAR